MGTKHDQAVDQEILDNTLHLRERYDATVKLIKAFNTQYNGKTMLYLSLTDSSDELHASFQIKYAINDPFIHNDIYHNGNAIIYPNDAVYLVIEALGGEYSVNWNNTRSTGWLSYDKKRSK